MEKARAKAVKSRAVQAIEYKDSNTFKADIAVATIEAYNLGFDDCKKKVADTFSSLDLHWIIPTGELEEDGEDKGEEPAQVISGDGIDEEVIKVFAPKVPEVAKALAGVLPVSVATSREAATIADPTKESSITSRD